jgi:molybdopterin converting factor small subunit
MVKVVLWGSLKAFAGGSDTVEVEAANVRELLTKLGDSYPGLKPQIDRGLSVSIDGKIYRDAWFQPITPKSEVYLLPRLAGG